MDTPNGYKAATIQHRAVSRLECLVLDLIAAQTQEINALDSLTRRLAAAVSNHPEDANLAAALEEAQALHARHTIIHSMLTVGARKLNAARDAAWSLVRTLKGAN